MSAIFTMQEVTEILDNVSRDYNSLIISAYQNNDEQKQKYYKTEFYRITFASSELKKFEDWGFCAITYIPVLQRWACLFPKNYKYIGGRSYPYSEDDPPILFVSGVVDGVLDEYLYKEYTQRNEREEV